VCMPKGNGVILDGEAQERREVELTRATEKKPTAAELPEPICPAGVVKPPLADVDEGFEEPPAPGTSPTR